VSNENAKIYFCPRFHVNFYHSYRSDTPDERGFGKDIRIIRSILDDLDVLESENIRVNCAWDFDNAFTLGQILPQNAPDILKRVRERVEAGKDEIELMSWNNGLLTAHTEEELRLALSWAISAPDGSGVLQIFGNYVPLARPQECMFTSSHIDIYRDLGIEALSLYYSAIPFNGFGSFVPKMSFAERFNPLRLKNPSTGSSLRLMPSINQGDIAEYFLSARHMLNIIRHEQVAARKITDMLVVLDMDADDTFWGGMMPRIFRGIIPSFSGLYSLIKSIAGLPFLVFERPWEYLKVHSDVGEIILGQDIADGAFDGYASWAEKYENYEIWTLIAKARTFWDEAKSIILNASFDENLCSSRSRDVMEWTSFLPPKMRDLALTTIRARILALSTTHFGMASPVMNASRLEKARAAAITALDLARSFREETKREFSACSDLKIEGKISTRHTEACRERPSIRAMKKGFLAISRGSRSIAISTPWVEYDRRIRRSTLEEVFDTDPQVRHFQGTLQLSGSKGPHIEWAREIKMVSSELVRIALTMRYPETPHIGYKLSKSKRLERTWDARWQQIAPIEIFAFQDIPVSTPIRVWKQDFEGNLTNYLLDYALYGRNTFLADINNHITPQWVALSDGTEGILVAQDSPDFQSYAFCPLRQEIHGERQNIILYPFGSLWGPQYRYPAHVTGLGRLGALLTADHLVSSAPSWEGKSISAAILIAFYNGDCPSDGVRQEIHRCLVLKD